MGDRKEISDAMKWYRHDMIVVLTDKHVNLWKHADTPRDIVTLVSRKLVKGDEYLGPAPRCENPKRNHEQKESGNVQDAKQELRHWNEPEDPDVQDSVEQHDNHHNEYCAPAAGFKPRVGHIDKCPDRKAHAIDNGSQSSEATKPRGPALNPCEEFPVRLGSPVVSPIVLRTRDRHD